MDREGALARLTLLASPATRPVLSAEDLGVILDAYAIPDAQGITPEDTASWEPTYDLNAAAAEAWRVKGARVTGDFNFSADGASFNKADVLAHCLEMEALYASRTKGTMHTGRSNLNLLDRVADRVIP